MKKFVSFSLVIVLTLSLALPAFAAPRADSEYDGRPLVIVRGMDLEGMLFDPGTENERNILSEISVTNILFGLGKAIVSCRYGSDFSDFIFSLVDFDGDLAVNSFTQYPQFILSGEDQSLNNF